MKLVVVADLHYMAGAGEGHRQGHLAELLLRRVVNRLNRFICPDLTVFLGDMVQDGMAGDAPERWRQLREVIDGLAAPSLVIPGNHDGQPDAFFKVFPALPEYLDAGGVRFVPFVDPEEPGYNARRLPRDIARLAGARRGWSGPIVSLQHVPLFPPGLGASPYHYLNAEEIISAMHASGVGLAVSGHYHPGFPPCQDEMTAYVAAPALCEAPFRFLELEVSSDGKLKTCVEHALRLPPELELTDNHVHSQFAYCSENMDFVKALELGREFGVAALGFTEHSGQLYFDQETFWRGAFLDAGMDCTQGLAARNGEYFAAARAAGVPDEWVGLEVDCDFRGRLVICEEDVRAAAFLVGSTHWLPSTRGRKETDAQVLAGELLGLLPQVLTSGIDVLAHPFRVFSRVGVPPPSSLVEEVVLLLARHNVAAEVNFHTQITDARFVELCLNHGVALSLGSDAHNLYEVGELYPHLQLLRQLGVSDGDLPRVLWHRRD